MLSSLPKLADRAFIFGFFLPTLLFGIVLLFMFQDLPNASQLLDDLAAKDVTKAAYVLLMVWVLASALLILNHPLYRFLEGYTFPDGLAEWLKARNRKRLADAQQELQTLFKRWAAERDKFPAADLSRYRKLKRDTARDLPSQPADILPTDFGNRIRAFEMYSRDIYGADGVFVWLRLATVIPKEVVEQIQDSRNQIDFLINCCFYSVIIAAVALARVVYAAFGSVPFADNPIAVWLILTADGLLAAYLFYRWAVLCVPAWGDWVMAAYDCYLPALAKQLGYELPPTEAERRQFWIGFSRQLIYRRDPNGKLNFDVDRWATVAKSDKPLGTKPVSISIDVNGREVD